MLVVIDVLNDIRLQRVSYHITRQTQEHRLHV